MSESSCSVEMKLGSCEICKQPTDRKCVGCRLVYYCSPDHQKDDWKVHREKCRAFEIACNPEFGRFLKSTRDLEVGDVIFSEVPLLIGPKPHLIEDGPFPCVGCCRLITEENCGQCSECLWPACSPQCEGLRDNLRHGLECRVLKLRPSVISSGSFYKYFRFDVLIILRALFLQKTNKSKWEQLMNLEHHLDKRGPRTEIYKLIDEKVHHLVENYLKPLKAYEEETQKAIFGPVPNDLIHKIYAILDVNATELTEEIDAEILYPTASLIEHNCTPNTYQIIGNARDNYRITFRASLPIQKSAHITSIYTHILWGTHARREHLKSTKYFLCNCERCKDPTELGSYISALKCLGSDQQPCGGIQLPVKPTEDHVRWLCDQCKIRLPNRDIMKFVNHLGGEVDKALSKQPSVEELEELLGKLLTFLHPNHYHIYAVKHSLIQLYNTKATGGVELSNDLLTEKVKMCYELIEVTKKIDPGNSRMMMYLSVIYLELFDAKFTLLNRSYDRDLRDKFLQEMHDIESLIAESKRILQYELKSTQGAKLFKVVCQNGLKFQNWLKEKEITG